MMARSTLDTTTSTATLADHSRVFRYLGHVIVGTQAATGESVERCDEPAEDEVHQRESAPAPMAATKAVEYRTEPLRST